MRNKILNIKKLIEATNILLVDSINRSDNGLTILIILKDLYKGLKWIDIVLKNADKLNIKIAILYRGNNLFEIVLVNINNEIISLDEIIINGNNTFLQEYYYVQ